MSESVWLAIIGVAGTILAGVIGHTLGQRAERRKQSLVIRSEMLRPIDDWLKGAEKMVGIFSDTMASIALNSRVPISYNFDERRKASNFMAEKTNEVFGIVASQSLQIGQSKRSALELGNVIRALDSLIKYELLPRESEIVDRSNNSTLSDGIMLDAGALKLQLDGLLQQAHSLVAQIRTALT